ncbi:MAG: hypothetical protein K0Q73_6715 [Paenibacillus sp.]|jgi:hypothetical protein|nr:hypothetical protein [Paenibacillus sp.]
MKNIRNLFFSSVLIAFIGWCMYFYLQEITSKLLVHLHLYYSYTILEMLLAVMGAFYMVIMIVMLIGYIFVMVVKKIKA